MCFALSINHPSNNKKEVARLYFISRKLKLFSIRVESPDSMSKAPRPHSVTIASGKKSSLIYICDLLFEYGYIISVDGKKFSKDKLITEMFEILFGIKINDLRQLRYEYRKGYLDDVFLNHMKRGHRN